MGVLIKVVGDGKGHPKSSRVRMSGLTIGSQERSTLLGALLGWAELFLLLVWSRSHAGRCAPSCR